MRQSYQTIKGRLNEASEANKGYPLYEGRPAMLMIPMKLATTGRLRFAKRATTGFGLIMLLWELVTKAGTDEIEFGAGGWFSFPGNELMTGQKSQRVQDAYVKRLVTMGLMQKRVTGFPPARELWMDYDAILALEASLPDDDPFGDDDDREGDFPDE